jgi:hypothetical protein
MTARIDVDALAPVRRALLAAADRDAAAIRTRARDAANQVLDDATARAGAIRADARAQGAAAAVRAVDLERTRLRRAGRATVLRARRETEEALASAARAAVGRLVDDPDFPRLRAGMVRALRRALGPDVGIHDHPDGGVVGVVDRRRVDFSLSRLADRVLDQVLAGEGDR